MKINWKEWEDELQEKRLSGSLIINLKILLGDDWEALFYMFFNWVADREPRYGGNLCSVHLHEREKFYTILKTFED